MLVAVQLLTYDSHINIIFIPKEVYSCVSSIEAEGMETGENIDCTEIG